MPLDDDIENSAVSIIEQLDDPIIFNQVFQRISKISLQMTLSYTFSFQMVFLVYLLSQLDDDEDHLAAITLITSFINAITMIGISPLMVFSKPLLTSIFNQQETTADIAADFIQYYAISIPAMMARICSEQVLFSFGRTKPAMLIGLTNFILCMGIGSSLALGTFGTKPLGTTGILIGCIMEAYFTALSFSLYIAHNSRFELFKSQSCR